MLTELLVSLRRDFQQRRVTTRRCRLVQRVNVLLLLDRGEPWAPKQVKVLRSDQRGCLGNRDEYRSPSHSASTESMQSECNQVPEFRTFPLPPCARAAPGLCSPTTCRALRNQSSVRRAPVQSDRS